MACPCQQRRNKLVATEKQGYLPSNIVKPFCGNVLNKHEDRQSGAWRTPVP